MALRNLVKNDTEFLGKKSRPVTQFDDKLAVLVEDMRETLRKEVGAGLAAPQVGILRRIFIADIHGDGSEYKEFINPEIISKTGKNDRYLEGCLSYPGRSFRIVRANKVKMRAQNVKGEFFDFVADDFVARCLQHEYDHLDGITIPMIGEEVFDHE
ncbi:MAG: peptide deformylase [Clostridia bacterium]|nr:peptide deformylase [Clostridia bacterium]MBR4087084.1 peptide deformylase [Clostridia bacterium]